MTPLEIITSHLNKESFSDLLDYSIQINDNFFIIDKYIGFMFELTPLLSAGDDASDIIHTLINSLPKGTIVQTIMFTSRYINNRLYDEYLKDIIPEFQAFAEGRVKFLLKGTKENLINNSNFKVRNFRLIISFKFINTISLEEIDKLQSGIKSSLQSIGLFPYNVTTNHLINICSELLNQSNNFEEQKVAYDPMKDISEQILVKENDIEVSKNHIRIGNIFYKTLSVVQYPEYWHINKMKELLGDIFNENRTLPFGFYICHNITILDDKKERSTFQTKYSAVNYQVQSGLANFRPKIKLKKQNYDIVAEQLEKGDKILSHNLTIITFSDSLNDLSYQESSIKSYYRVLGFNIESNIYIHLITLFMNLPLLYNEKIDRILKLSYKNLSSRISLFPPIIGEWGGTLNPRILLLSRLGQLISFDIYDSPGGYNGCVIAKTGSGKSFLTNEIITQYLACNARVFTIDIGYSYQKLNEVYDGQFIDIDDNCEFSFNPFTNVINIDEDIDMMINLIATMCVIKEDLSDLQLSFIRDAIIDVWNKKGYDSSLDDVHDFFINHKDERYHDLGKLISSFIKGGEFEKYFHSGIPINFKKSFISLDLEKIKNREKLLNVVLLSIISGISKSVYLGDRNRKQLIVIDEAWDLFDHPIVGNFLVAAYRKFRKYRASCFIIVQGLNDLYQTPSGRVIYDNSDWMFLLKQNKEAIMSITKDDKMLLNEQQINEMASLQVKPGEYSEVMISSSTGQQMGPKVIGRLIVDRQTQLIYSTTAKEVAVINNIKEKYNCSTLKAIQIFINQENQEDIEEDIIDLFRR